MKNVVQDLTSAGIDWQREKWKSGFGSKFIRQGEKNAVKYADEIVVLSKGVQDYAVVNAMEPRRIENLKVVQLAGGMGEPNSQFDGSSVAFNLAAHLSGSCHCIFGPAILSNEHMVKELEQVPAVHQVMELASKANIYLTGIAFV